MARKYQRQRDHDVQGAKTLMLSLNNYQQLCYQILSPPGLLLLKSGKNELTDPLCTKNVCHEAAKDESDYTGYTMIEEILKQMWVFFQP